MKRFLKVQLPLYPGALPSSPGIWFDSINHRYGLWLMVRSDAHQQNMLTLYATLHGAFDEHQALRWAARQVLALVKTR